MKVTKGQIIAITTGICSDYCLRGHVIALKDFDAIREAEKFKNSSDEYLDKRWIGKAGYSEATAMRMAEYGSEHRFLAWAIREGLIEEAQAGVVCELYIGGDRLEIE